MELKIVKLKFKLAINYYIALLFWVYRKYEVQVPHHHLLLE